MKCNLLCFNLIYHVILTKIMHCSKTFIYKLIITYCLLKALYNDYCNLHINNLKICQSILRGIFYPHSWTLHAKFRQGIIIGHALDCHEWLERSSAGNKSLWKWYRRCKLSLMKEYFQPWCTNSEPLRSKQCTFAFLDGAILYIPNSTRVTLK